MSNSHVDVAISLYGEGPSGLYMFNMYFTIVKFNEIELGNLIDHKITNFGYHVINFVKNNKYKTISSVIMENGPNFMVGLQPTIYNEFFK